MKQINVRVLLAAGALALPWGLVSADAQTAPRPNRKRPQPHPPNPRPAPERERQHQQNQPGPSGLGQPVPGLSRPDREALHRFLSAL